MRVLFWGTPDFATPPLRALIGEGFDVVAVVTQPDKPVGRSRSTLHASPVKQVAIAEGIEVLQPDRPRGEGFLAAARALEPDISVVVAYGHILPREVIDLPRLGTINVHASLLPALRGAAPIHAAIRDGLEETGVSIMRMVPRLDAGPVLHRIRTPIAEDETGGELSLRLWSSAPSRRSRRWRCSSLGGTAQCLRTSSRRPMRERSIEARRVSTGIVARPSCARLIRAMDPRPGALATYRYAEVKLFGGRIVPGRTEELPGTVVAIDDDGMTVACGSGAVRLTAVQPAGKRLLTPAEWARGRGIALGERLS